MAITQPTFEGYTEAQITTFNSILAAFQHGKMYISDGAITKTEADVMFADLTQMASDLGDKAVELGDLGENPGKEESKVEKLKTTNYVIEGKRTNTIELNLAGLSQDRKDWLEQELNKVARTVILVSSGGDDVIVFTNLRWSYERSTELNKLFNATIATEYAGVTGSKYFIYQDISEAAS
jgi:hypothetical protein